LAPAPNFSWEQKTNGDVLLTAHISQGSNGALDPDLFSLQSDYAYRIHLGAPQEIRWLPDNGPAESLAWTCMNATLLARPLEQLSNPYAHLSGLLDHRSSGRLQFLFPAAGATVLAEKSKISGSYLSGRSFQAQLNTDHRPAVPEIALEGLFIDQAEGAEPADDTSSQEIILNSGDFNPKLSPDLLKGFPNPFRDVIQLRFQVPVTMGDAFVWDKDGAPPAGLDLLAAVPWQGGSPNVSVKIYSINGQELVTLFSGSQGPGENTVQWAGTDNFGRQVASGTYFCKLQMDDWSITRRLVYLR